MCAAALLCGVSMWRVNWEEEAVEARKHSLAMQAERLLQNPSADMDDDENSLNGQGSHLPGESCDIRHMSVGHKQHLMPEALLIAALLYCHGLLHVSVRMLLWNWLMF